MAENGKAQSSLGELFVDFGTRGVGGLLKNLNTVSASFLLGKNAANQFAQTLTKPVKEAGSSAVAVGKLATSLGSTFTEAYKFKMVMKNFNMSESLLSEISGLQQVLYDFHKGVGELPSSLSVAFNELGLNVNDYSGSLESVLNLTDEIQKRTSKMSALDANQNLRFMGLSSEWRYFWDRGGSLRDASLITDAEVEKNIKAQEAMSRMGTNMEQLKFTIISKLTPAVETIANFFSGFSRNATKDIIEGTVIKNFNPSMPLAINSKLGLTGYDANIQQNIQDNTKTGKITPPIMQSETGKIPPNVSNTNKTTNLTVNQDININANNPEKIIEQATKKPLDEYLLQSQLFNTVIN